MEVILLGIYSFFAWLIFGKFKLLPWNIVSQVITITIPIIGLAIIMLILNIVAPVSGDVRAMNYVIPIVPRVTGQVTEVPIEPNRPIAKGDVLFKLDPVPFQAALHAAEATLAMDKVALLSAQASQRGLDESLKNAVAMKESLLPRIELAKTRVAQFTQLSETGAGRRADLEEAQAELARLQSDLLAAEAKEGEARQKLSAVNEQGELDLVANARAKIAKSEADVIAAKYDLEGTTHLAPANGRVANLALRPGVRAVQLPLAPVMSFIEEDDPWVLAFYNQNELRYVEPGQEAEIFVKTHPGLIIKCKVDSILWATAQGQMPISGSLPNTAPIAAPAQRIAVRLIVENKDQKEKLFLAAGARGGGAIYTEKGKLVHIIRKVIVRVQTKLDWFVVKHVPTGGGH